MGTARAAAIRELDTINAIIADIDKRIESATLPLVKNQCRESRLRWIEKKERLIDYYNL